MAESIVSGKLRNGETILFEVDEPETFSGPKAVALRKEDGTIDLDGALAGVRQAASQVLETLRSIAVQPDSCEISFGVKLSGSMGAIIAKASTEANFTIKLVWKASPGNSH
jgi:hypothetical protein